MKLEVTWREVGPRVEIHAQVKDDGQGLYKAYLRGDSGRMLLGTLMPEAGWLTLNRTCSKESLRQQGVWPFRGGDAVLVYSFQPLVPPNGWNWLEEPENIFGHGEPACYLSDIPHLLYRRVGREIQLAFPYQADKPYPLANYFCFSTLCILDEKIYGFISFTP